MSLREQLRRLATLSPNRFPFVSVYLNLTPQGPGILTYPAFLKKRLSEEFRRYPERSPQHESLERVSARIHDFLDYDLPPHAKSVVFFARSSQGEFFEAIPLPVELPTHAVVVSRKPYVYPLVRLSHLFPVALAAVVDTNTARIFVISLGRTVSRREVHNMNVHKPKSGGMAQERLHRHVEDHYLHHAKETAQVLDRLVRETGASYVLLGGDEVIVPELKSRLSRFVRDRLIAEAHWDIRIPEHELIERVTEEVRRTERSRRRRRAEEVVETANANGHATLGPVSTLAALLAGKVDELLVVEAARDDGRAKVCTECDTATVDLSASTCPRCEGDRLVEAPLRTELVNRALAQGGTVQVVEPIDSLEGVGGIAAALRYK